MIADLENFRGRFSLTIDFEVIDIDQQPALEATWGDKVPVLLNGESEICHYYFNEASMIDALSPRYNDCVVAADGGNRLK